MRLSRRTVIGSMLSACIAGRRLFALNESALPVVGHTGETRGIEPAYLSNGLLGIRPGRIPLAQAPTCVAGFVFVHPDFHVESLSPAPYPLTTDIRLNGISLLDSPELCALKSQRLDMSTGELTTELSFNAGESLVATITVLQIALRTQPSLLLQRLTVRMSSAARLEIAPQISTGSLPGKVLREDLRFAGTDRVLLFESLGELSRLGTAIIVQPEQGFTWQPRLNAYVGDGQTGGTYRFDTLASSVSSFYHREPEQEAIRLVHWGTQTGVEILIEGNRRAWSELWKSRVVVTGDLEDQRALDYAFFYLHSSNHASNLNGMAPFGFSSSRYYLGHSFWDTETWSLLPLLLASPATAKSLLQFRQRGLEAAKRVAGLFGYQGAQFPWEAAPSDGEEVTPVFAATGWAEQHIVPDVALAFWQYQMATKDPSFLIEGTWPVLSAVARWIESRGVQTQRGFEILNIMGPDEASNGLNNSAYVNLGCRQVLFSAIRCASMVGTPAPESWKKIAASMYLPVNREGMMTIAEGSRNHAFGDLSYLLPFDCATEPSVLKKTWQAYEADRSSAPMIAFAKVAESALAATMGDRARAGRLFRDSWSPDLLAPFEMTREANPQTHGCFLTNQGSLLRTAMLGFTGLRINEGPWNKYEAALPETWQAIEIESVYIAGKRKRIIARHGAKAEIIDAS